ncbi:MAG TPA: hypothetical protein VMU51_33785 [Mycobacteriales bacterium]|jgi:hypothetical protein|nr:hypothetical protein [Mycobacteriales bacterium]
MTVDTTVPQTEVAYTRGDDRLPMLHGPVGVEQIVGRWRNPDQASGGISDIDVELRDGQLYARVAGLGPDGLIDWGEVPAELFADISMTGGQRAAVGPDDAGQVPPHYADISSSGGGPAFLATFDHGFLRVDLQCRLNLGLLVVAIYSQFTDDSGRPNYFLRPVYARR